MVPSFKLYNGIDIPSIGLGTYGLNQQTMLNSLRALYESGSTLVDTACSYDNEMLIGNSIKALYNENVLKREDLFIETKVGDKLYDDGSPRGFYFYNSSSCISHDTKKVVYEQVEQSLKQLNTDYIDLLLIHWPYNDVLFEIWKILEELYEQKVCRAIGVSNFKVRHLKMLMSSANYVPMVDQLCISPINLLEEEYDFCKKYNIVIEAYSPLNTLKNKVIVHTHKEFFDLADKYDRNINQILLRWFYQKGIITIPKSSDASRVRMNTNIFNFVLTKDDMIYIDSLNYNYQYLVESKFCPGY